MSLPPAPESRKAKILRYKEELWFLFNLGHGYFLLG